MSQKVLKAFRGTAIEQAGFIKNQLPTVIREKRVRFVKSHHRQPGPDQNIVPLNLLLRLLPQNLL